MSSDAPPGKTCTTASLGLAAKVHAYAQGGGSILVYNAAGAFSTWIRNNDDGGMIAIYNASKMEGTRSPTVLLSSDAAGGRLRVNNATGKRTTGIVNDEDGVGVLTIHNASGEISTVLKSDDNGGQLWITNLSGEITAALDNSEEGGRLGIRSSSGKTTTLIDNNGSGGAVAWADALFGEGTERSGAGSGVFEQLSAPPFLAGVAPVARDAQAGGLGVVEYLQRATRLGAPHPGGSCESRGVLTDRGETHQA